MRQNSFAEACPKLEESERIDPAVGTLLYLGECYERAGKTASAWATFREAASLATNSGQPDRARVAAARAQEIEPKLSRLSVELAPPVAGIPGVSVKRGNQRLEASVHGTPLPVDPAEYRIEVSAPGYETWSTRVLVDPGGTASVRVPGLVKAPESAPPPASPALSNDGNRTSKRVAPESKPAANTGLTTQQTVGIVVGSVGLLGVGLGSFFGIRAISKNSDAEQHCPRGALCDDQAGEDLTNKAKDNARASNIAFAVGGGLVALGAVVYLTGGRKQDTEHVALVPLLSSGVAAGSLVGRF